MYNEDKILIANLIVAEGLSPLSNFNSLSRAYYDDEDLWAYSTEKTKYLWYACLKGNLVRVKFLIEKCDADIRKKNKINYKNALNYAMEGGNMDVVKYLIHLKCYPGNYEEWSKNIRQNLSKKNGGLGLGLNQCLTLLCL